MRSLYSNAPAERPGLTFALLHLSAKKIPLDTLAGAGRVGGAAGAAKPAAGSTAASSGQNVKLGEDGAKKEACAC